MTLKLALLGEKQLVLEANGVHTAFAQAVENLQARPEVSLFVNEIPADVDVLHAHTMGPRYFMASRRYGSRLIVSAHIVPDSFLHSFVLDKIVRAMAKVYLRFGLNRARLVIAVSPTVKSQLEQLGITREIAVLPNSVDRQKFRPDPRLRSLLRQRLGLQKDDFVVLGVGQLQPRKGIMTFVDVAQHLPKLKFVWVGGRPYGRLTADYRHVTRLVQCPPGNVTFLGTVPHEEMPGYYAMADVFFMPSYQECFSMAVLEASATTLPLVLRDNPEYPGTLFGHYLHAMQVGEFEAILDRLSWDRAFLEQWQGESHRLASCYEIGPYIGRLVALYQRVAQQSGT